MFHKRFVEMKKRGKQLKTVASVRDVFKKINCDLVFARVKNMFYFIVTVRCEIILEKFVNFPH